MRDVSLDLFYESTLVDSVAQPDSELQCMVEDRNIGVAVVDDFRRAIMRPKAR